MILAPKASHFFPKDPHTSLKVVQSSRVRCVVGASKGGAPPSEEVAALGRVRCLLPCIITTTRSCMKRLRIIDAEFSPKAGLAIHPGVPDEPKYALIHKGWTAQPKCYSRFVCQLSPLLHRCNTIICSCFFYCLSLPFILFLVLSLFFRQGFTFNCFSMCVADTFVVAAFLGLHQICVPKELHRDHPAFLSA